MFKKDKDKKKKDGDSRKRTSFIRKRSTKEVKLPDYGQLDLLGVNPDQRRELINVLPRILVYLRSSVAATEGLFIRNPELSAVDTGADTSNPKAFFKKLIEEMVACCAVNSTTSPEADLLPKYDAHIWANAVKKIFKELEKPLIIGGICEKLVQPQTNVAVRVKHCRYVLEDLPHKNFEILKTLCVLCYECPSENDKLGYMFGALLLLPPLGNQISTNAAEGAIGAMRFLIDRCEDVFDVVPNKSAQQGLPPNNVVEPVAAALASMEVTPAASALGAADNNNSDPVTKVNMKFDFQGDEEDELDAKAGEVLELVQEEDDGWTTVRRVFEDGTVEEGIVPAGYYEIVPGEAAASPPPPIAHAEQAIKRLSSNSSLQEQHPPTAPITSPIAPVTTSEPAHESAVALFDFQAQDAGELDLVKDDPIVLLDKSDPEWWYGRNASGKEGLFPMTYVKVLATPASSTPAAPAALAINPSSPARATIAALPSTSPVHAQTSHKPAPSSPPPAPPVRTTPPPANLPQQPPPQRTNTPPVREPRPGPPPRQQPGGAPPPVKPKSAAAPPPLTARPTSSSRAATPPQPAPGRIPPKPAHAPPPVPGGKANTTAPGHTINAVAARTASETAKAMQQQNQDPRAMGWVIDKQKYAFYQRFFVQMAEQHPDGKMYVPGRVAGQFLMDSKLPKATVARILELSDIDKDSKFDQDEYIVAHHLSYCISKRGMPLPQKLPSYLIPKTKRSLLTGN